MARPTHSQLAAWGAKGAYARLSREDPHEMTKRANKSREERLLAKVDAAAADRGEVLSDAERSRRAECLLKLEMAERRAARKAPSLTPKPPRPAKPPTPERAEDLRREVKQLRDLVYSLWNRIDLLESSGAE